MEGGCDGSGVNTIWLLLLGLVLQLCGCCRNVVAIHPILDQQLCVCKRLLLVDALPQTFDCDFGRVATHKLRRGSLRSLPQGEQS